VSSRQVDFARITVRVRERELAERIIAEAHAAGASGLEEREEEGVIELLVYAPVARAQRVADAVALPGAEVVGVEHEAPVDWSESWKRELGPIEISPALRVRPSFTPAPLPAGQRELLIDPGQAFGTGAHESTHLALEWVAALAPGLDAGVRVLDVGTGSGVLALAALCLSDARAVVFDLDPLAGSAARDNAAINGLADRFAGFTGPLGALRGGEHFELVVANLLASELRPIFDPLMERVAPAGRLVLSGLLVSECAPLLARSEAAGLRLEGERRREDGSGVAWASLCMARSTSS
jgi:ribosomal protein L11 methyltransferase